MRRRRSTYVFLHDRITPFPVLLNRKKFHDLPRNFSSQKLNLTRFLYFRGDFCKNQKCMFGKSFVEKFCINPRSSTAVPQIQKKLKTLPVKRPGGGGRGCGKGDQVILIHKLTKRL